MAGLDKLSLNTINSTNERFTFKLSIGAIFLFFLIGIYFVAQSIISYDGSIIFTYLFFGLLGYLISSSGEKLAVFMFHYAVFAGIAVFFYHYFIQTNGVPFIGGGDDELFHSFSSSVYKKDFDIDHIYDGGLLLVVGYRGYILILSSYFWLVNAIGFESTHVYHLILFNVFVGGLTSNYIFRLARNLKIRDLRWVLLVSLFPVTVFHEVTLLRDSWLFLVFLVLANFVFEEHKLSVKQWILAVILIFISLNFRLVHGVIFSFLLGLLVLFKVNKRRNQVLLVLVAGVIVFVSLNSFLFSEIERINRVSEYYNGEISENASQTSLGALFFESNNPLVKVISPLFVFYKPIPPVVFSGLNFKNVFLSFGNIAWYLSLTTYFVGLVRMNKFDVIRRRFLIITFIVLVFSILIVSASSKEDRHLLFLYPLVNLSSLLFIQEDSKLLKKVILGMTGISFALVSLYFFLKAIL